MFTDKELQRLKIKMVLLAIGLLLGFGAFMSWLEHRYARGPKITYTDVVILEDCRDGVCYDPITKQAIGPDKLPFQLTSPVPEQK